MIAVENDYYQVVDDYVRKIVLWLNTRYDAYTITTEELQNFLNYEYGKGVDDCRKMTAISLVFEIQREKTLEYYKHSLGQVNDELRRQDKQLQGWQKEASLLAQQLRDTQIELSRRPL
jgi:hypothetical protein